MELAFDLTAEQAIPRGGDAHVLGFAELTAAARSPRGLARTLWRGRNEAVVVHEDDIPKSAKQAAAALLAGTARASRRQLDRGGSQRDVSAPGLLGHGIWELARAVPRELRDTRRLRRRAEADCEARRELPGAPRRSGCSTCAATRR